MRCKSRWFVGVVVAVATVFPAVVSAEQCDCAREQCAPYDADADFVGTVIEGSGTHPNGTNQRFLVLVMEGRRVCADRVATTPVQEGEFDVDTPNQAELQLHIPDVPTYRRLQAMVRRAGRPARIRVTGRVWHGHTAHHHRDLLVTVRSFTRL